MKIDTLKLKNDPIEAAIEDNTSWEEIDIRGRRFFLNRIDDMEKLLDAVSDQEFNIDERLPYWAEVWPSAIALSEFIDENKSEFSGKSILEIGCGLGLVGIVATANGGNVLFTDHDEYALRFTQINFTRNFKRPATVQNLDWRVVDTDRKFEIIIAADVLYEKRWLEAVVNVIEKKLAPDGTVYIAEPDRTVARDFFTMIGRKKWRHRSLLKRTMVCNKLHSITIYRIRKC
jgi:predicted nicotinamide N-methyase